MTFSRFVEYAMVFLFFISIGGSFFSYAQYNYLPVNLLFDLHIVFLFVVCISSLLHRAVFFVFFLVGLLVLSLLYNYMSDDVLFSDYIIANKSFFYIFMLCFIAGKEIYSSILIKRIYIYLLAFFLYKYSAWIVFGTYISRPGVFYENNFELPLLLLLNLSLINLDETVPNIYNYILFVVVLLSGSLSGVASFCVMQFVLSLSNPENSENKIYYKLLVFLLLGIVSVFYFSYRVTDVEHVDRFVFLTELINNIKNRDILSFLFGNVGLRPLSSDTCNTLSFYSTLFSAKNDGSCYSVILHAYVLRVIFDHGLLGLVFTFSSMYYMLYLSKVSIRVSIASILVLLVNSLSVSGPNNPFYMLGFIMLIASYKGKKGSKHDQC